MTVVSSKAKRYDRIFNQINELLVATTDPTARIATIAALLHHKFSNFFWTGFYQLIDGELIIGPYQGPIACLKLKRHTGVCWAGVDRAESILVADVHDFPGHIACSSLSNSEIVVPVYNQSNEIVAILDVDSREFNSFDEDDKVGLEKIAKLIYSA